jgi:hypothetical protein
MAHAEVAAATRNVADGQQQLSVHREDQMKFLADGEHQEWLIARSGSALSAMTSTHMLQYQRRREQVAAAAAQAEVQLRRELRQVEQVMSRAAREERLFANRKEQHQLDEVARLMGRPRDKMILPLEPT